MPSRLTRKQQEQINIQLRKEARAAFNSDFSNVEKFREENPDYAEDFRQLRNESHRAYYRSHQELECARSRGLYKSVGDKKGFLDADGTFVRTRSLSEAYFAVYLQQAGIKFEYEPTRMATPLGIYTPDFYLPEYNIFIEIKGEGILKLYPEASAKQASKRQYLKEQGVNIALMSASHIENEVGL